MHRDLKPENLFITRDGHIRISRFWRGEFRAARNPERTDGNAASPVDHRSDIFGYGIVLHEMLAGKRTFTGESSIEIMNAIMQEEASPLPDSAPHLPA